MVQAAHKTSREIGGDVSSQLFWDNRIDASDIGVNVTDGKVVLTGTVPACSDRSQAEEDAYSIAGVSFVDNRLAVSYPAAGEAPDDAEIASQIRSVLEWNPHIGPGKVDVSVEEGTVALTGTVESIWQRSMAGSTAYNIRGVLNVRNLLRVKPARPVPDDEIAHRVLRVLENNVLIDTSLINVHVKDGVVTLSGTVHNHHALHAAEGLAGITAGVRDVNNYLVIT
jgi:osmotically-inducible protein OsmY